MIFGKGEQPRVELGKNPATKGIAGFGSYFISLA